MALNKSYKNVLAKLRELQEALQQNKVANANYPALLAERIAVVIANIEKNNLTQGILTSNISKENAENLSESYDNMVLAVDNILKPGNVSILADMETIEKNIQYLETANGNNQSIYNNPKQKQVSAAQDDSDSDEDASLEQALQKAEMNKMRPRQTTSGSSASSSSSSASSSSSNGKDTRDRKEKKVNSNAIVFVESLVQGIKGNIKEKGILRVPGNRNYIEGVFKNYEEQSARVKQYTHMKSVHLMSKKEACDLHEGAVVHDLAGCLKEICKNPALIGLKPVDNSALRNQILKQGSSSDVSANFKVALNNMPASHIKILQKMFEFIITLEENKKSNLMDFANIETTFLPRVMEFMGLATPSEIPKNLTSDEGRRYQADVVKADELITAMILLNIQDKSVNQVFKEALDAKHNQNDFSDTVYEDKQELDSKGTDNKFMSVGGWKLSRSSRAPAQPEEAHKIEEEHKISDPKLTGTSNGDAVNTNSRNNNNNNNNNNRF